MSEIKPKQLTVKQERFCREYVLCMNASEAYRRAYECDKSKPETVWRRASELIANSTVKARIQELKQDVEEALGISKVTMVQTLQEVIERSLQKVPVMKFDKFQKEEVQVIDPETGEGVWQYDSAGVNSAVDKIMKAMGYYAAEKVQTQQLDKDGNPIDPNQIIKVKIE